MVRTQVQLTNAQHEALVALAKATGKKPSELIREAIHGLIDQSSAKRRALILDRAAGMWKGRKDLPDFRALRAQWDRRQ
jgi:hypothetical protein